MKKTQAISPHKSMRYTVQRNDITAVAIILSVIGILVYFPGALDTFKRLSRDYAYTMSFAKFAILATFGECLALRITSGHYTRRGFGILPKMFVWGLMGMVIKVAFVIFATGTPNVLASLGLEIDASTLAIGTFSGKVVTALAISTCMNLIFAPVMMTLHKITDIHIHNHGGRLTALSSPLDVVGILQKIDWQIMFNFIFKKTVPLFWIPAHTVTFLLPGEFQILFAALLGIALGAILAFARS